MPSRSESFGLVALEAAACGTPVVASAVGGLRTLVDHGHSGFLVEGRDPEVFASYAEELLTNDVLAADMSVAAATRASRLHVVDVGRAAPPALRRPHRRRTRRVLVTFDHPATDAELDAVEARIDGWLQRQLGENPILVAVDRGEPGERRWYVRLRGEEKDFTTIWLTPRAAHVAVRDVRDARARGEPRHVLRAPAAAQREARRRAVLHRRRERGVPRRRVPDRSRWTTPSSTASWGRSTPASSSASDRPSASGSPRDFRPDWDLTSQCISCHSVLGPRAPRSLVRGSPVTRCALGSRARCSP